MKVKILAKALYSDFRPGRAPGAKTYEVGEEADFPAYYAVGLIQAGLAEALEAEVQAEEAQAEEVEAEDAEAPEEPAEKPKTVVKKRARGSKAEDPAEEKGE